MTAATPSIVPPNHFSFEDTAFPSLEIFFFFKLRKEERRGEEFDHSRENSQPRLLTFQNFNTILGELVMAD